MRTGLAHDIATLTEEIWLSTAGMAAHPLEVWDDGALTGPTLDGVINITGDWQGAVLLQVPRPLAGQVAAHMFHLGEEAPSRQDVHDALGEITNMTGGNIKALMAGACHLSLPVVVDGTDYSIGIPGTRVVERVVFQCAGQLGVVSVLAANPPRTAQA
ncbi:MAG: chemotaxis protein CheX [Vicinamibacterales bacterium]|nr:chemotaxis protein CheX [Vicinamibacterales bacterium]